MRNCQILILAVASGFMFHLSSQAQTLTARDYAIEITASIQESPPQITLNWRNNGDGLEYYVQRKLKDGYQWDDGVILSSDATSYVDTSINIGESYEYSITQWPPPPFAVSGYIMAGINVPLTDFHGTLLLLVDSTFSETLAAELAQLEQDMIGDGWKVIRHDVSRDATPPEIKAIIQSDYWADAVNTKAVFLFGHVPVPYSGDYNPDAHDIHKGAWVADTYYGDMDGVWTDDTVYDTEAVRPANQNVPGDGKFDQSQIPADLKLQVGRVDLYDMPSFLPRTEEDLLRDYLNRNHQFRMGMLSEPRRALVFNGFGDSGGLAYASCAWRNFTPFFTSDNITEVGWDQFLSTVDTDGYLWSYAGSGGDPNYTDCYGLGQTDYFASISLKTVFMMMFGSFFGDWDATDCILRAPLCSGECISVVWSGAPHWFFHPMALGETTGYCALLTQNNPGLYYPTNLIRCPHVSLLGDPTLRMHVVMPPSSLAANATGNSVALSWSASIDSDLQGYHVYRATSPNGPFVRLTSSPIPDSSYAEAVDPGSYTYMVRAVKFETSPSGSYFNLSQGAFVTTTVPPVAMISLANPRIIAGQMVFDCEGQAGEQFVVERSVDLTNWTPISTNVLTDSVFQFEDSNPPGSSPSFYRARLVP